MIFFLLISGCDQRVHLDNNPLYSSDFAAQGIDKDEDGWLIEEGDCNDNNPLTYPGAQEICDGEDNDCDRVLDESDPDLDRSTLIQQFRDQDGDGYGQTLISAKSCFVRAGYATKPDDCNDDAPLIHPQAPEICDSIDNDCDLLIDQDDPNLVPTRWFEDKDEDTSGSDSSFIDIDDCSSPPGFVLDSGDCNDDNPEIHGLDTDGDGVSICEEDCDDLDSLRSPNANEYCDGIDNNCNGKIDNKDPLVFGAYWYKDADGDGFGNPIDVYLHPDCTSPFGWVHNRDDCNDAEPNVFPQNLEICDNGIDDDCNGAIDCADSTCFDTPECPTKTMAVCAEEADTKLTGQVPGSSLLAAYMGQNRIVYAIDTTLFEQNGSSWQAPESIVALSSIDDFDGDGQLDAIAFSQNQSFLFSSQNTSFSPVQVINATGTNALSCAQEIIIINGTSINIVGGETYSFTDLSPSMICIDRNQDGQEELWFSIPSQGEIRSLNLTDGTISLQKTIPPAQKILLSRAGDINEDTIEDFLLLSDQNPINIVINPQDETTDSSISHLYTNPWRTITSTDTNQDGLQEIIISTTTVDDRGEVIFIHGEDIRTAIQTETSIQEVGLVIHTPFAQSHFGDSMVATPSHLLITAPQYHIQNDEHGAIYEYIFPLLSDSLAFPDEDGDGFGAIAPPIETCLISSTEYLGDCQDTRSFTTPYAIEDCTNGLDDDCDGYIDEGDRDCQPDFQENCADLKDNDEDGLIDCLDPECLGTLSCGIATRISSGTVQRNLFPSPLEDCSDPLCIEYPQGYCSLTVQMQGEVRVPLEAQSFDTCSFELLLEYRSSEANCSVLEKTENIFSSSCLESLESIPAILTADELGSPTTIDGYDFFKLHSVKEKYEDGSFVWTGTILPQPIK